MVDCRNTYGLFLVMFMLLVSMQVSAEITLPKVIGSNMVLQRYKPVTIWGNASLGENITVTFAKQVKKTTADSQGKWFVTFAPMAASDKPSQMLVSGSNTISIENILIGEVWLCSGQSNMEYTMAKSSKYADAMRSKGLTPEELKNERNLNIRLFLVKRDLNKPGDINKGWQSAEGAALGAFSAAGYFFAKKLYQELKIPIGVISSSISGSAIEPWMSGTIEKDSKGKGSDAGLEINETEPGKFYAGMIRPLAPFALKGFLWYQGETNCFLKETSEYTYKFRHLINSWRKLWNNKNAPFYFVQIAPFNYSKSKGKIELNEQSLPEFREAQALVLDMPNTAMIITTDLVDNLEDIHPSYKWEVGRRLALFALSNTYGKKVIAFSGPVYKEMVVKESKVEIEFDYCGSGLMSNDGQPLNSFTIGDVDGKFVPADAVIKGNKVIVSSPKISDPVHVRFAWNEAAQPNLYNRDGLPAAPFRTDNPNYSNGKTNSVRK